MLHSGDLRRPRYQQDLQVGARPPHGSVRSLHGRSDPAETTEARISVKRAWLRGLACPAARPTQP
jgi:hypothetical protein